MTSNGRAFLFALSCLFVFGVCRVSWGGMLFADGVDVEGGGGVVVDSGVKAGGYDVLPMRYEDMGKYDKIAMEPYREGYDALSVEAKARLYGRQFEYMRNRKPNFDPAVLGAGAGVVDEDGDDDGVDGGRSGWHEFGRPAAGVRGGAVAGGGGEHDILPMWYDEMGRYEQIAMEPYRDRYDSLSVGEKARLYGRQFEYMKGRPPNFHPDVLEAMRSGDESRAVSVNKSYMYKPATPKRGGGRGGDGGDVLGGLSGPWERVGGGDVRGDGDGYTEEPRGVGRGGDRRMESLREGWNAVDVLRGARDR